MSTVWQTCNRIKPFTLLLLLLLGMMHTAQGATDRPSTKIDPALWEQIQSRGSNDFIIVLSEQADLSGAAQLGTKEAKGQFVFDALRDHAIRTQAGVRAQLDGAGRDYQPFYISNKIYVASGDAQLLTALASRNDVSQLIPNRRYQLVEPQRSDKETTSRAIESNLIFINADQVWAQGVTGEGVVLAGNDTGIQWDHPALKMHYRGWDGSSADHNYNWWDATSTYPTAPGDGNGHGTHTTGTMVGDDGGSNQIGVAPGAQTIHCKNLTDDGFGSDADIIECFQWDLAPWDLSGNNPRPDLAPDAINNSWGGGGGNPAFMTEIDALQTAGILVEFSAGNNGPSCNTLGSPGDFPQLLTTGSVDHSSGVLPGTITYFSSRGSSPFTDEPLPDIMAPGENIRSSVPAGNYAVFSGTSMSGPHVTGLIALMWSANPGLRGLIPETQQIIMQTAVPLSGQVGSNCGGDYETGPNNDWGYGTIDALAAVNAAAFYGDPGTLTGTVSDSERNDPIAGAIVRAELTADLVWKRTTDDSGIYSATVFSGTYSVSANKYGFFPTTIENVAVTSEMTTTLDIALDPAPFYTVSGTVLDAATGWPLHAQIKINGYPGDPIWSDPVTGAYRIDLAAGVEYVFQVTAWVDGYTPTSQVVAPLSGDSVVDFALSADPFLCAAPGYEPEYVYFDDFENGDGGFVVDGTNSSWAFGVPTTGPNVAHSGDNVWATNLSGNYNDGEQSYIVSPIIDLSGSAGHNIIVNWWEWLQTEPCCDYVTLEVSADGGQSWSQAYYNSSDLAIGWQKRSIVLDSFFASADFRVRFGLYSDGSVTFPGYYVDDFGIGVASRPPSLYSEDFELGDGGYVISGTNASWAYGTPTRGPGGAHSGVSAWATNLDGNYNDNETSSLTSPVIDLSAGAGQMLQVSWWQWLQVEANFDSLAIDYSADGGATWQLVYNFSGVQDFGWNQYFLFLDPSQVSDSFQLRYTLTSDGNVTYPGFYLDDVQIAPFDESTPAAPCITPSGGLIVGTVRDGNTDIALNGAAVSSATGVEVVSGSAENDGFYTLYADSGTDSITASKRSYQTAVESVTAVAGDTVAHDFALGAGILTSDPASLAVTLDVNGTTTVPLTLQNGGAAELTYRLRESNGAFTPARTTGQGVWLSQDKTGVALRNNQGEVATAFPSAYQWTADSPAADVHVLLYADDPFHPAPNTYPDQALQAVGLSYTAFYDSNFADFRAALSGQTWDIVIFANDNWFPAEADLIALTDYVASGGHLIFHSWTVGFTPQIPLYASLGVQWQSDNFEPPNPIYWWEPAHPLFNLPQQVPQLLTPQSVGFSVYGQQVEPLGEAIALAGATETSQPAQATLVLGNEGRTVFKGFLDGQHNADSDGDGSADLLELWINLLDGIQTDFSYDVAWLALDSETGMIPANSSTAVNLTIDASVAEIDQPGDYAATLRVGNDTPYGTLKVPVTLTVRPPADWGKLTGEIVDLKRCDVAGDPLRNVTVSVAGIEIKTRGDGLYTRWLPAATYEVSVTKEGYATQTFSVDLQAGATETHNIGLRRLLACGNANPDSTTLTLPQYEQRAVELTLENSGSADWQYTILETPFELVPTPNLPRAVGDESFAAARQTGVTSLQNYAELGGLVAPDGARTGWFGGAENPVGAVRYAAAQCPEEPNKFYVISGVDRLGSISKILWQYDATTNDWTSLLPIPTGQEAATAVCYQGRLYVMGGGGTTQFYIFDLAEREWLVGASLPRNVEGAAAAAWNGKVYLVGGDTDFFPASGVSDEVNIYDIATDTWEANGATMPVAAGNAGSVQAGPYLYVVGGWGVDAPDSNITATQRYDIINDVWELGPTFEAARADFALAVTEQALYAIGGDKDGGFFFEGTKGVERLALSGWSDGAWETFADALPVPLSANNAGFCTTAVFNTTVAEIWSVGGADGAGIGTRSLFHELAGENCYSIFGDVAWISVGRASGVISADATTSLNLRIDATHLQAGIHSATLVITGGGRQIWHPVTVLVTGQTRIYLPIIRSAP